MTTRRITLARRLRTAALATILAATSFAATVAPVSRPAGDTGSSPFDGIIEIANQLFAPKDALAAFCASNPGFTGYLTASPTSHAAVAQITNSHVYAYISNVNKAWSCTAYLRYDGVAWNVTSTKGRFDWGLLITSTSVPCNYVVGTNDFVKGNPTADCDDSDAEYAMDIHLTKERVYQQDVDHDSVGDLSFVHSDCGTVYGGGDGEALSGTEDDPVNFNATNANNRPGANCDPITLDGFQTAQTITYDNTPPALNFDAPLALSGAPGGSYTVQFDVTDAIAGFGGTAGWKLQRQVTTVASPGVCNAFTPNEYDLVEPASGVNTANASNVQVAQTLAAGSCYRWVLSATDKNGKTASLTSANVIVDDTAPSAEFVTPIPGTTSAQNVNPYTVRWTEADAGSGIATRSLQRQRVAISGGACGGGWADDGSPVTSGSPVSATLASYCYRWLLTVTDRAGNTSAQATSGTILYSSVYPMADFSAPDEPTTTAQSTTSYQVAWTETWGHLLSAHASTPRSLQRQRGQVVTPNSCTGITFADDGSPSTGTSPVSASGLVDGYAYRWVQTLKNIANNSGPVTSGCVIIDTTAPVGSIDSPDANAAASGAVEIAGTASDDGSFDEYTLDYGAGTSPGSWTSIGTYTSPVTTTGTLGTWDPGTLSGIYTLRLTVADAAGNTPSVTTRTVVLENAMRGDEAYYTRVPYDLGGGWALDVGVANGEARLTRDLFSIPSYGPAQGLALTYSSAESGATGRFGVGWSSNLTQYLTFDLASAVTTWHRADGGRVPFGNVAGTWTPPRGQFETMTVSGSEVTITTRDQTRFVFESSGAGRLKRIENRFGKALTLVWNTSSATATDASGRATTLTIDSGNSRITGATDSAGRSWTFGYTGTGASSDLTCVTDPASKVTRLGYTSHVLTSIVRGSAGCTSGGTTSWSIGYTSGKATSVTSPEVSHPDVFTYGAGTATWRQVYDDTTPDYADTTYTLDAAGRGWVTDIGNPENATTHREFDLDGNVIVETTPEDEELEATYEYDAAGNVTREERVLERETAESSEVTVVTTSTYNSANDLLTRTDADNDADTRTVTRYTYDGSGHLVSENRNCTTTGTTIPGEGAGGSCTGAGTQNADTNVITNYAYTANDQLESEQDPRGYVTKHVYDTYGNETAVIANCTSSGTTPPSPFDSCTTTNGSNGGTHDAQTNVVRTTAYDAGTAAGKAGLATSSADALGRATAYTHDALGRQLTEVLPGDSSIPALTRTTTYDEYGNALTAAESWTPSGGSLQTRTTTHTYDLEQRETEVLDPTSQTRTATSHDPADNVVEEVVGSVTGTPVATTTRRTYDRVGNPVSETLVGPTSEVQPQVSTYTPSGLPHTRAAADGTMQLAGYRLDGSATSIATYAAEDGQFQSPIGKHLTTYDTLGREVGVEDTDAFTTDDTTSTYDRLGRLLTTTTAQRTTSYTYDRAGNQLTVTDPAGIVTTTTYDPLGRATVTIANDVAGPSSPVEDITTTSFYDAAGNTVAVEDARGVTSRSVLNVRDQVSRTIANCTDAGTTPTSNPASCTGAGTHNNATNVVTDTTYDGQGNAVRTVSAVGLSGYTATTETAYDAAGRVQASKDAMGTITASIYNAAGQLTDTYVNCTTSGTTIPTDWANCSGAGTANGTYNLHTAYTYDEWGNQASATAPNGRQTHSLYDESNRLVAVIDNYVNGVAETAGGVTDDVTTEIAYDDAGRQAVTWTWNADGTRQSATVTTYNDDGTIAQVIVNCSDDTATPPAPPATSDDAIACTGSGTKTADANLITTNTYDPAGQLVQVQAPDPSATTGGATGTVTTQYAHDDAGRLCRVVENATGSTNLATLTRPCTDATQTAGTATANVSTRYTYDGAGNLASMIDAAANTTTYAYDAVGHPTGRTDALDASLIWTYDDIGNQIYQRNRTDSVMTNSVVWTHDPAGRILTRTADSATTTYTYDLAGNKLTASDGTLTITAAYDRLNRVLTVDDEDAGTTADTTYTYSLTSPTWSDPTGSYAATLDPFDRATVLDDPADTGTSNWTWTYGTAGQILSGTQGNANAIAQAFDAAGHLLDRETKTGGTSRAHYVYTYNRAGQILSEASTVTGDAANGTVTYGYDPLGQLTGSTFSGTTTAYGWDTTTNRTSVQVGGGTAATTAYDAANRPTSGATPTAAYTSDADGRLTARPNQTMTWDHLGRLTAVKDAAGTTTLAAYTYDPLDRLRTVDYGGGNRIRFRYVGLTTSAAQWLDDVAGTVTRSIGNGWGGERLMDWTGTSSNRRFYGDNAHHDVTWLADSSGAVSQSLRYDPWGTPRSTVPQGYTPFRFQGSWHDATTDLAWVVTRWYAQSLGRFVSEDSLLGQPMEPDSRHLYAYAAGDPVGAWDPSGMSWCSRRCTAAGLYQGAATRMWTGTIRNPTHLRGRFWANLFISTKWAIFEPWHMKGDWRNYKADGCLESRACVELNFDQNIARVTVRPTCERVDNDDSWYECTDAQDINTWHPFANAVKFNETRGGVISLEWSLVPSRSMALAPIDGFVEVTPPGSWKKNRHGDRVKLTPGFYIKTDGYPTFESYFRDASGTWIIMRDWEGSFPWDLGPGVGDEYKRVSWPRP